MMKIFAETKGKLIVMLVVACQLISPACQRQLYPEQSFQNIEGSAERKRLDDFLNSGVEKGLNTKTASADEIVETAEKYLGVPHCMGGTTMKCMDCSGLLVTVFAGLGITLPHNSEEQARYGKIISRIDELKKGDLVFFIRSYQTSHFITHSGIYTGSNKFIHASTKNGVIITSINDPWWNQKFIFGTRVLKQ
ncbi:MAG: C40 family peptidase [Bacteroidales bacterium]|jgi:cell wall-associated NlpC family hydrolase|nr:C40 family peptidase [Bacteroidales bacterium]